jgi:hypothetical protein
MAAVGQSDVTKKTPIGKPDILNRGECRQMDRSGQETLVVPCSFEASSPRASRETLFASSARLDCRRVTCIGWPTWEPCHEPPTVPYAYRSRRICLGLRNIALRPRVPYTSRRPGRTRAARWSTATGVNLLDQGLRLSDQVPARLRGRAVEYAGDCDLFLPPCGLRRSGYEGQRHHRLLGNSYAQAGSDHGEQHHALYRCLYGPSKGTRCT